MASKYCLDANPIGLVIIAVAALAAGIIFAYTHSETFRNIVNTLWNDMKTVGGWIAATFVPQIQLIVDIFNIVVNAINSAISALDKFMNKSSSASSAKVPGHALGTDNFEGGLTMVGESGAELVALPGGSKIYDNNETNNIMNNQQGGGVTININNPSVRNDNDITTIINQVKQALGRQNQLVRMGVM